MSSPLESLDPLLLSLLRANREKVAGWIRDEPGSWGFLAGKAVAACREQAGRPLTDPERRLVWQRLWQLLSQLREQTAK